MKLRSRPEPPADEAPPERTDAELVAILREHGHDARRYLWPGEWPRLQAAAARLVGQGQLSLGMLLAQAERGGRVADEADPDRGLHREYANGGRLPGRDASQDAPLPSSGGVNGVDVELARAEAYERLTSPRKRLSA